MDESTQLVEHLDRCRDRLHALPEVVGSGVGLRQGEPVIEIYVSGRAEPELERSIRELVGTDFVLVPESRAAEAQTQHQTERSE